MPTIIGWINPASSRVNKSRIAAAYAGVKLDEADKYALQAAEPEAFKNNCHPLGAGPVLQTEGGYVFESSAILRHIGRLGNASGIYGSTDLEASNIDSWLDYASTELDSAVVEIHIMAAGFAPVDEARIAVLAPQIGAALEGLDRWLEIRTFLVGERPTIADFAIFTTVDTLLRYGLSAASEAYKYKNVIRHHLTVLHQPKVQQALKAAGHDGLIPAKPKKEEPKKEEKKKEEKPAKKEEAAEAHDEDEGEDFPQEKKKPNPLDALPPSPFVLDAFKREYSNTDTRKVAAPYFFDKFDNAGFSAWWCNYKYNDENKLPFMTSNLIRGWFQRMDHVRKYGFGVALIVGEETKHEITALWVFRGKGLPEIVLEVDDTELFTWTEIADVKAEAAKITDYLCWDGETFAAKPVLEGRAFK